MARMIKEWGAIPLSNQALTGDGTTLGGSLAFVAAATIMRCLGEYVITPTSTPTGGDAVAIAIGLGIASTDAVTAGAGSLPDPSGEGDFPWLYWKRHAFFMADGAVAPRIANALRMEFDVRSMRRIRPGQSLFWVSEYADIAGTPPMQCILTGVRVLFGT